MLRSLHSVNVLHLTYSKSGRLELEYELVTIHWCARRRRLLYAHFLVRSFVEILLRSVIVTACFSSRSTYVRSASMVPCV